MSLIIYCTIFLFSFHLCGQFLMDFNTFWHVFVWYFWVVYCNSNHDLALLGNLKHNGFFIYVHTYLLLSLWSIFILFDLTKFNLDLFYREKNILFRKKTRNNDWLYFVKNSAYFQFSMSQKWFIIWSQAIKQRMISYISKSRIRNIYQKPI